MEKRKEKVGGVKRIRKELEIWTILMGGNE